MRKNLPLIVGIGLPVLFVIVLFIAVAIPNSNIHPGHDFVYTFDGVAPYYSDTYRDTYAVQDGHIVPKPIQTTNTASSAALKDRAPLYLYDVQNDSTHEISLADAQALSLVPGPSSPEGYTVDYRYGSEGIFDLVGGSHNENGYYLVFKNGTRKLSGLGSNYNGYNFHLIGWVK
jgi:hypothetical protein